MEEKKKEEVINPHHLPRERGRLENQQGLGLDRHDEAGAYVDKAPPEMQKVWP